MGRTESCPRGSTAPASPSARSAVSFSFPLVFPFWRCLWEGGWFPPPSSRISVWPPPSCILDSSLDLAGLLVFSTPRLFFQTFRPHSDPPFLPSMSWAETQALDPAQDVLVAHKQNHEPLMPDHGFPVRMIIPGRAFDARGRGSKERKRKANPPPLKNSLFFSQAST